MFYLWNEPVYLFSHPFQIRFIWFKELIYEAALG